VSGVRKRATVRKPPARILVAWCPVCGEIGCAVLTDERHTLPDRCQQCPYEDWPDDHPPYVMVLPFDLAPKQGRSKDREARIAEHKS
jgi:hypothetical protein